MKGDRGGSGRYALAYFTLFSIYGVTSPYLQVMIRGLGYGPAAVGLFLSLFEIMGIVGPLIVSRLADAAGRRRPALALSGLAVLAALPGLALVPKPAATALSIVLFSVGLKTLVPLMDAQAVAFVDKGRRRGGYGALRAVGTLGFIAAAMVLQVIPGLDDAPPWAIALCMGAAALAFLASLPFLPEMERHPKAAPEADGRPAAARRFEPVFAIGLLVIGMGRFAMAPVNSFISLYATEGLHLHAVGGLWSLAAATEVPLMLVAGIIIARTGTMAAIAISTAAVGLRLATYALFPTPAGLFAGQLLHSLCYGLFQPAAVAFVAECVPPERRSTGMAIFMGLGVGLPAVLGSALGGFIVESWGYRVLFASFIAFALASLAIYAANRRRFSRPARPGLNPAP
jgi:PPP family 3-phenylpropionic acid transporter